MAVLNPKGVIAADEKLLLIIATLLMLIVVIPVIVLTLVFAWKYRATNVKARYSPNWGHNTILEIIWWTIPCVIILILAIITWIATHKLDPYKPIATEKPSLIIQVVALDWKWLFIYPVQDIATINFVQIPVNQPIKFLITADAPMNSFQIPQLAGQIYAMTGMQTQLHLMATHIGNYNGFSANFSGDGFASMTFEVKVSTAEEFEQWVNQVRQSPKKLSLDEYNLLVPPSENNPVAYYSSVTPNLYNTIIMNYMMPMPSKGAHNG